jgi:hypothetical protein
MTHNTAIRKFSTSVLGYEERGRRSIDPFPDQNFAVSKNGTSDDWSGVIICEVRKHHFPRVYRHTTICSGHGISSDLRKSISLRGKFVFKHFPELKLRASKWFLAKEVPRELLNLNQR